MEDSGFLEMVHDEFYPDGFRKTITNSKNEILEIIHFYFPEWVSIPIKNARN